MRHDHLLLLLQNGADQLLVLLLQVLFGHVLQQRVHRRRHGIGWASQPLLRLRGLLWLWRGLHRPQALVHPLRGHRSGRGLGPDGGPRRGPHAAARADAGGHGRRRHGLLAAEPRVGVGVAGAGADEGDLARRRGGGEVGAGGGHPLGQRGGGALGKARGLSEPLVVGVGSLAILAILALLELLDTVCVPEGVQGVLAARR
mmetsp:Transcript_2858/g.5350  ORF Transcript_2858/g.5350 Transcript_2858/m.5350 type:complete len:201 (+) Transcript_2858:2308-2910(+)